MIDCLQPFQAVASPAMPDRRSYPTLDERNPVVAALLRFQPYKLSDEVVRSKLRELLVAMSRMPAWGSEEESTPAETYVYAARAYIRANNKNRGKLRLNLELAHMLYRERNVLDRWGDFEEFKFHAYTDTESRIRVAVYLAGQEKAEPIADLPETLRRDQVEDLLTMCYSGYVRGRRDGRFELRAEAQQIACVPAND